LQVLNIAENQIAAIPAEILELTSLKIINADGNQLTVIFVY